MNTIISLVLVASATFLGCEKKMRGENYSFYDWSVLGAKAPSVLPDIKRDKVIFKVKSMQRTAVYKSAPVLSPYNVTMDFDTLIDGEVGGRASAIETHSALLAGVQVKPGDELELEVGSEHPKQVFSVLQLPR